MDPVLAARLARQSEKVATGESAVEHVGRTGFTPDKNGMDPLLVQRLSRQLEKTDSQLDDKLRKLRESPEQKGQTALDPVLAARFAKQQQKLETGESAVDEASLKSNVAIQLDPKLAKRFAEQLEKAENGESAVSEVGSAAAPPSRIGDPRLAARLSQQKEKERTGDTRALDLVPSPCRSGRSIVDEGLAERLHQQRSKLEEPTQKTGAESKDDDQEDEREQEQLDSRTTAGSPASPRRSGAPKKKKQSLLATLIVAVALLVVLVAGARHSENPEHAGCCAWLLAALLSACVLLGLARASALGIVVFLIVGILVADKPMARRPASAAIFHRAVTAF